MRIRIRNRREMWLFIGAVTVLSVAVSEAVLILLYLSFGDAAFGTIDVVSLTNTSSLPVPVEGSDGASRQEANATDTTTQP